MKKLLSVLLLLPLMPCILSPSVFAADAENMENYPHKRENIFVRDPYILVYDGLYYMYGTGLATCAGYGCRVSPDLENWSEPYNVFVADSSFDAAGDFWAPECHYYNGNFYLFATYRSKTTGFRGTSVFKSSSPLGPFEEISNGHITSHECDNIDGTLYVDEDGQPWICYVCEWTSTDDNIGRMAVAKLSDDLSSIISTPKEIFRADDAPWSSSQVTDGPFLYKNSDGTLLMLWSSGSHEGYSVGIAKSDNGKIDGNWSQQFTRIYSRTFYYDTKGNALDGGHAMLFNSLDGKLMMSIHAPNAGFEKDGKTVFAHLEYFEMEEKFDTLRIEKFHCYNRAFDMLVTLFNRISDIFEKIFNL